MILLVDDIQQNLFSLRSLLKMHAYETDISFSGEDALKKILKNEYELIILDVQMPGMDGFEVAEAITSLNKTKDIPIIFLSAVNIDKRFITKGYHSGGVDYITKPFDPDMLLLKVKTFCRLYQQTKTLKEMQAELQKEIEISKKAKAAVDEMNIRLEEKVRERTSELLQMNRELQNSNTELAQYAYIASHDLQEPLRKISTFTNMIQEKFLLNIPDAEEYIERIKSSSDRMRLLINDLLKYSNVSAESYFSAVDLNKILTEVLSDLELVINEKKAVIEIQPLAIIDAIPSQMRQVFQNLLSNAIKFSKSGTAPVINVWGEFTNELSISATATEKGNYYRIYIKDNGIGFDEKYLAKIFTIFQRLHGRTEYEGTGIGLAVVKKIIDKHLGEISAKSKDGEGTTFILILPVMHEKRKQN